MTIPLSQRFDILERDHYTCRFCGRRAPETELEVDHLQPRSKGGLDVPENLATTCRDCNRGKGDRAITLPGTDWTSLVGKFFHSFDKDHYVHWQGQVEAMVTDGVYMVGLFSWLHGAWSHREMVTLQQMVDERWHWYETADDMREAHQYAYGGVLDRPLPEMNGHSEIVVIGGEDEEDS